MLTEIQTYTLFSGLFVSLCTAAGAAIVFLIKRNNNESIAQITLGFSGGVMLAASIFSLLLPALEGSENKSDNLVPVIIGFVLGIALLIIIDKSLPHLHALSDTPEGPKTNFNKSTLLFLALTIHNIPEGMALGVAIAAFSIDPSTISMIVVLAFGLGLQNIPEGAAVSMPLYIDGKSKIRSFVFGALSGIVEPIAATIVVLCSSFVADLLPFFLSFAAGAMLYVVVEELIPQSHEFEHSDKATISVLSGFILMMVLDVALG